MVLPAHAVSFDCMRVHVPAEEKICLDTELSRLDDNLAQAYKQAHEQSQGKSESRKAQQRWIKERNACKDAECLKWAYSRRIAEPEGSATGHYTLVDGFNHLVCRDLTDNLNRHPEWPPLACGMRVDNISSKFSMPVWESLEVRANLPLFRQASKDSSSPAADRVLGPSAERFFQEQLTAGHVKIERTRIDINKDGRKETLYRLTVRSCDPADPNDFNFGNGPRLYATDESGHMPDITFQALFTPPKGLFLYEGKPYLTWWSGAHHFRSASLTVIEPRAPLPNTFYDGFICTLMYHH